MQGINPRSGNYPKTDARSVRVVEQSPTTLEDYHTYKNGGRKSTIQQYTENLNKALNDTPITSDVDYTAGKVFTKKVINTVDPEIL